MSLILIQIILTIIYYNNSFFILRKYIFNVSDKFISYLLNQSNNNKAIINNKINGTKNKMIKYPPRKKAMIEKEKEKKGKKQIIKKKRKKYRKKYRKKESNCSLNNNMLSENLCPSNNQLYISSNLNSKLFEQAKINNRSSFLVTMKNQIDLNIENYLATQPEDMDYDDAIRKDKRKMCEIF